MLRVFFSPLPRAQLVFKMSWASTMRENTERDLIWIIPSSRIPNHHSLLGNLSRFVLARYRSIMLSTIVKLLSDLFGSDGIYLYFGQDRALIRWESHLLKSGDLIAAKNILELILMVTFSLSLVVPLSSESRASSETKNSLQWESSLLSRIFKPQSDACFLALLLSLLFQQLILALESLAPEEREFDVSRLLSSSSLAHFFSNDALFSLPFPLSFSSSGRTKGSQTRFSFSGSCFLQGRPFERTSKEKGLACRWRRQRYESRSVNQRSHHSIPKHPRLSFILSPLDS